MRLLSLALENIGPFDHADLRFLDEPAEAVPVAFITGENGTGKSIVLDAIRGLFGARWAKLERDITREEMGPVIEAQAVVDGETIVLASSQFDRQEQSFLPREIRSKHTTIQQLFETSRFACPAWIVDYWRPGIPTGSFDISSLARSTPKSYLEQSLQGNIRNAQVTELICFFDYLRDSRSVDERHTGDLL